MKGISPFIATVLIISFTIGAAALLGPWIYSLTKSQSDVIGGETETRLDCQYGGIRIDDDSIKCDFTGSLYFLNFTLENTGTKDMYNFTCEIYLNGIIYEYGINNSINNQTFTSSTPLKPSQVRTVAVNITGDLPSANPEWIRVRVPKCPTVDDRSTDVSCS